MNIPLLVAVVGHPSTGKDTVARYIVEKYHCTHVSMSDLLREYIVEQKLGEPNRDLLHDVGDLLRGTHGADYLVKLALERAQPPAVFSGLRVIKEAETFKKKGGMIIAITTPIEVRYERTKARGGVKDNVSFEKFKAQQESEASNINPNEMNVEAVISMADFTIENMGTLGELYDRVDEVLKK